MDINLENVYKTSKNEIVGFCETVYDFLKNYTVGTTEELKKNPHNLLTLELSAVQLIATYNMAKSSDLPLTYETLLSLYLTVDAFTHMGNFGVNNHGVGFIGMWREIVLDVVSKFLNNKYKTIKSKII